DGVGLGAGLGGGVGVGLNGGASILEGGFGGANNVGGFGLRRYGSKSYSLPTLPCGPGHYTNAVGVCEEAVITQNVFAFDGPDLPANVGPTPYIPRPRVDYNVVFVRTPNRPYPLDPIVVPPPQQQTLVYVLTENGQLQQQVIQAPAQAPLDPEVRYVNYNDHKYGHNHGGGVALQDVFSGSRSRYGGYHK
ncbi:UNVERIFIED_CONTAM: hypothetical protein GTU68_025898, partial [Idotea baltica]|nr:hypothetical protein [Idotea baltica]